MLGLAALLAAVPAMSCGGGGDSCSTPAACGGDIVGNWTVTSSCLHFSGALDDNACPGATIDASARYSGQASYNADMTYSLDVSVTGSETVFIPPSCLSITCAEADQMYQTTPPAGVASGHCSSAGTGCSCTLVFSEQPQTETGTYTLSGSSVTTTSSTSDVETDQYCAQANHLDIIPSASGLAPGATVTGGISLTKQ